MRGTSLPWAIVALLALLAALQILPRGDVASATGVVSLAAGDAHACAVTLAGGVKCWGSNQSGELGNGEISAEPSPVAADVLEAPDGAPLAGITEVTAGFGHTCALSETGGVKCWGKNAVGQLGDGQACGNDCATPVDVPVLSSGVAAVSAGANHTCALLDEGSVACWGLNHFLQLGHVTPPDQFCFVEAFPCSTTPVNVTGLSVTAVAVRAGTEHTCALTEAGGIVCWGKNRQGQLGDGTTADSVDPVTVCFAYDDAAGECTQQLSGAVAVELGLEHTCALVEVDAGQEGYGVKCWGKAVSGQLGDGQCCVLGTNSLVPVDVIGLTSGASALAAGLNHNCAAMAKGGARCWGSNGGGQLGNGSAGGLSATPVVVMELSGNSSALAGGRSFSCAVDVEGAVSCWGLNDDGQLGDATTAASTAPSPVFGLGPPPDSDGDGCADTQELGTNPAHGGQRDPKNFWDFFDTPDAANVRNRLISASDIFRLVQRFGATGDKGMDPLSDPGEASAYHTAFDRQPSGGGPDGAIAAADIAIVVEQFGHTCAGTA